MNISEGSGRGFQTGEFTLPTLFRACAGGPNVSRFPKADFILSVAAPVQFPADTGAEVAFAGRSNAGKSSAINAISGRKALARTSKTPGQTRLLNYFELEAGHRIVDLPGYGYADIRAEERRKWVPLLNALRERESLRGLLLIVDCRRGLRDEDLGLIEWADPSRRRIHVLIAKADKLNQAERAAALRDAQAVLGDAATAQLFSAHSGLGVIEARERLDELWANTQG
jgi:GTP-binding protein